MNEFECTGIFTAIESSNRGLENHIIIIYKLQLNNADLIIFDDLKASCHI